MTKTLLDDAFAHHVWATLRVMDVCAGLDRAQLEATSPGTYGTILDSLRHIVAADSSYLFAMTGGTVQPIDEERMQLPELRSLMESYGPEYVSLLASDLDPDRIVVRHRDDGSETHAPLGIRLAQVVHHGTDHRSQICTILTTLGIEPPLIDVWDFADQDGRLVEVPPTA
ncbi:MAG TPA: DinB family protein [Actinomycetota bacterium]|nr:DinB family protein [Actinomycetota bacterium]